jgi:hypothetical protein
MGARSGPPRPGALRLSPRARRIFLASALAIWVALIVGGCFVGYALAPTTSRGICTVLRGFAGAAVFVVAVWTLVIAVNVKGMRAKRGAGRQR